MKTRDEFDWWLTCLPDKVAALRARLPDLAGALDGGVASIEPLVAHLIAHHDYDALIAPAQAELLDQVTAYVGDVAERAMPGCAWAIPLDDPSDADHGLPILRFSDGRLAFNPLTYVTTAVDRRDPTLVGRAIVRRRTPG